MSFLFLLTELGVRPHPRHPASELVQKHIDRGGGTGGRWYIPPSWLEDAQSANHSLLSGLHPTTVLEAAQLALELSLLTSSFAPRSRIPLIAHQTWRSLKTSAWPETVQRSVDSWLSAATPSNGSQHADMAYILWDDNGVDQLMKKYEPTLFELFRGLPYPVEKADIFRVAVIHWFGGFYGDVDVNLLQHPDDWIQAGDVLPWTDTLTSTSHGPDNSLHVASSPDPNTGVTAYPYQIPLGCPSLYEQLMNRGLAQESSNDNVVGAVFGIECDTDPRSSHYWRWGYSYPVQLTNWAMASAPLHPSTSAYMTQVTSEIRTNLSVLHSIDPLDLTGPPALTKAVNASAALLTGSNLRWNSLTGLSDPPGGRGKVIAGDVLILPITGFSPGRGRYQNMGSMPTTHDSARLVHQAQGSWRKTDWRVELGKVCRSQLGLCRNWKKIP
ncbi:MAG: hypothetical protein Q9162_000563 [Coniocarpon cinnabarinum]